MANLNKVMLIGRLTRDPEIRVFANGGKVAKFGFAVNNRKKNSTTGQYEEDPVFIDMNAYNWERRKLADLVEQYLKKGHQTFIEGNLVFEQWTGQDGQKKSKLSVTVDNIQFLEPRSDGGSGGYRNAVASGPTRGAASPPPMEEGYDEPSPTFAPPDKRVDDEIPF